MDWSHIGSNYMLQHVISGKIEGNEEEEEKEEEDLSSYWITLRKKKTSMFYLRQYKFLT
jgi:hypothetical protein